MVTIGAPSYSFQYKLIHGGSTTGIRTINNLNFKMNSDDDGITATMWYDFMINVTHALGMSFEGTTAKVIENRLFDGTEGGD